MASEDVCIRLGRRVRKLRKERGRAQTYLSVHTGLGRPFISNIRPCRAIVDQVVGNLKTEASGKAVPIDDALASELLNWRGRCPYNQDTDFLFGSPEMDGQQPYWPDSLLRKVIRPAAVRAGITKHIGWHSFRRTLATLLQANGVSVKATQEMLRHASSRLTMDLYAQSIPEDRRSAQSGIIGAVLAASVPKRSHDNLEVVVGA